MKTKYIISCAMPAVIFLTWCTAPAAKDDTADTSDVSRQLVASGNTAQAVEHNFEKAITFESRGEIVVFINQEKVL